MIRWFLIFILVLKLKSLTFSFIRYFWSRSKRFAKGYSAYNEAEEHKCAKDFIKDSGYLEWVFSIEKLL